MKQPQDPIDVELMSAPVDFTFGLTRRSFMQALGAGLLIATAVATADAQEGPATRPSRPRRPRGGGMWGGGPTKLGARLHLGRDGSITVLTGKVEGGQGARAEISEAAAEELRVPVERITLIMADTDLVPNDGLTAGSRTTPSTLPPVRQACAAARQLLVAYAAKQWNVAADSVDVHDGAAVHEQQKMTYAQLAAAPDTAKVWDADVPADVSVTAVKDWQVLGRPTPRPNGRDLVTGKHRFPSDHVLPGMLYGKVLRPPTYGAELQSIDLGPAKAMEGVIAVQDGPFCGVAASNTAAARKSLKAIEASAKWKEKANPSSKEIYDYLRAHTREPVPENPFKDEAAKAAQVLKATYLVPYVQHAPLEPRAALAEWSDGHLTVWTTTQNPFGVRRELADAFSMPEDRVRVIVPDFGSGFGGRHTGETAVEAARLALAAGKPVAVHWTRVEEFSWAYFRPAAVIDLQASLDSAGKLTSWHHVTLNAGAPGIECPYRAGSVRSDPVACESPLRQGSYRALAATANNFARESFIDEVAAAAKADPLEFRLAHLENARLKAVLEKAADSFGWKARRAAAKADGQTGVGLACGTEKGSCVAACVEIRIDPKTGAVSVSRVTEAFECGAITNPDNLRNQISGAIVMGLGPALREAMEFADGKFLNASFFKYPVPRFADLPELKIELVDRPDIPSAGAGETPIIAIAPAIGNAIFQTTGTRLREMPLRLPTRAAKM